LCVAEHDGSVAHSCEHFAERSSTKAKRSQFCWFRNVDRSVRQNGCCPCCWRACTGKERRTCCSAHVSLDYLLVVMNENVCDRHVVWNSVISLPAHRDTGVSSIWSPQTSTCMCSINFLSNTYTFWLTKFRTLKTEKFCGKMKSSGFSHPNLFCGAKHDTSVNSLQSEVPPRKRSQCVGFELFSRNVNPVRQSGCCQCCWYMCRGMNRCTDYSVLLVCCHE
jgi:hypothetical protein